ncbi:M56 family metallopeptidase [Tautonia plasticadhaerens]|uniref:BlaR1 peptidase M56 n=1 Tax=Tautonia plasticadhaerens TaxID=2527974 RepID=A0A518GXK5_9BACT|nr:M56 family metallopeptidase [Tautonia plasticadhaerens]QDV33328.1 BlaR1 peptidase M56 [Tautonia plasticadhaerens]
MGIGRRGSVADGTSGRRGDERMVAAVDRLGPWLLDVGVLASGWFGLVMLLMVGTRQPIRRRDLARAGAIGSLALIPLSAVPIGRVGYTLDLPGAVGPVAAEAMGRAFSAIPVDLARVLTIGYLAAAAAGVGWSLLGTWAMRGLVRTTRPASMGARKLYQALPFEGGSRRPALGVSDRVRRPVLVGGRRRTIVIPEDWDRDDPAAAVRLRLGMLHELAHAERGDPAFHWVAGVSHAVWFAIPFSWWLRRQLRIDQEFLADNRAARSFGDAASGYAASLVETAAKGARPGSWGVTTPGGSDRVDLDGSPLLQRVAMLVHCPFPVEGSSPASWRWGVPLVATLVLLAASRLNLALGPPGESSPGPAGRPVAFGLSDLEIDVATSHRSLRLPARLPDRFDLSMDLLAESSTLGEIAVAGVPLGRMARVRPEDAPGPEAWHRVRLVVLGGLARLWVDGHPRAGVTWDPIPGGFLTITPAPGRPLRVRDLSLTPVAADPEPLPGAEPGPRPSTSPMASVR